MKKHEFIESYIEELLNALEMFQSAQVSEEYLIDTIIEICNVFSNEIPGVKESVRLRIGTVERDARTLIGILKFHMLTEAEESAHALSAVKEVDAGEPIIFLSHKSNDKKYGDALEKFITGLGVKNDQLIYTSHPLHKIPLDKNIYDYLRENIHKNVFMIILWSNDYLESSACMNEMGALWVTQADYTNIYLPDFSFGNPKYHECAVDTRKMGAVLNGDAHCKTAMIELKDKIINLFDLKIDEKAFTYILDEFIKDITEGK